MTAMADGQYGELQALTILDFSDRELLLIVMEICDASDGYAGSAEIAEALGMKGKNPIGSVGSRMASLKRIGAVMKDPEAPASHSSRWAVTPTGASIATGRLKASTERAIEAMDDGALVLLARKVGMRQRQSGATAGQILRREWQNSTGLKR